jgi:hypothetical protein
MLLRGLIARPVVHFSAIASIAMLAGGCRTGSEFHGMAGLGGFEMEGERGFDPIIDGSNVAGQFAFGFDTPVMADAGPADGTGFRAGGRVGFTYTREDLGERSIAGEPLLSIEEFADLTIFMPQATFSYRQLLTGVPETGGSVIEPGVGVGPAIGILGFGSELQFANDPVDTDIDEWETAVGLGVQPFLRAAYVGQGYAVGLEGGYVATTIDFDDALGRDTQSWYVGIYFSARVGD